MMLESMATFSDPPKGKPGTGTWVIPTEDLITAHPELAGEEGRVLESEQGTVIVKWNGRSKPYRIPLAYITTKED